MVSTGAVLGPPAPQAASSRTETWRAYAISPLPPEKAAILKRYVERKAIQVALHGCTHEAIYSPAVSDLTEFKGLDEKSQEEKIRKGRDFLEQALGFNVRTFVPPFESYDLTTVGVLEKLGFRCLSADLHGAVPDSSPLLFLPSTCHLRDVRRAVGTARRCGAPERVVVALFHPYDFREVNEKQGCLSFAEFEGLLDWLGSQDDVRVISMNQALGTAEDLSARRYRRNAWIQRLQDGYDPLPVLVPAAWNPEAPGVYQGTDAILRKSIASFLFVGLAYPAALASGFGLAFWGGRRLGGGLRGRLQAGAYGCSAVTLALVAVLLAHATVGYKGLLLVSALIGLSVGAWWAVRRRVTAVGGRQQGTRGRHEVRAPQERSPDEVSRKA